MKEGYIKLWRKIMETSFYKKPSVAHLAIHLLLKANHRPSEVIWNGKALTVNPGQLITGREALSRETGLSNQQIRTALSILSDPTIGFLTITSTNKFSTISLVKYEDYQAKQPASQQTNNQQATSRATSTSTTNKKIKKIKNEEEDIYITPKEDKMKIPPSLAEVSNYCRERNNGINPERWYDYYTANGWRVGRNKMTDWQAAVRLWESNKSWQNTSSQTKSTEELKAEAMSG